MAQIVIGEAGFDMTAMVVASTAGTTDSNSDTLTIFDAPYRDGIVRFGLDEPLGANIVSMDLFAGPDAATGEVLFSIFDFAIPGETLGTPFMNKDDPGLLAALLAGDDGISGGPGNDLLIGQLGNDTVRGNDGDDLVGGGVGDDRLEGGASNDGVDGGDGNDLLLGGAGNDRMIADDGADFVFGEEGEDLLGGGAGDDRLGGGAGSDILDGSDHGDDSMDGGDDADTLATGLGNDEATGGEGADIFVLRAGPPADPEGVGETDRILDFDFAAGDRLRNDTGLSLVDLLATADPAAQGIVLTLGEKDTVLIVDLTAITADYFIT